MPKKAAKKPARKAASKTTAKRKPVKAVKAKKAAPSKVKATAVTKKKVDVSKIKPLSDKLTKTQVIQAIAEHTGLAKADITEVFKALAVCVHGQMHKKGFGEFTIPETGVKIRRIRKPATKARKMVSPFSGEEITVKAKPARNVVKVTALKSLKDSVKAG